MNLNMRNGRIVIDGREFHGSNVIMSNGRVTVDGVVQDGELSGQISVTVHGDVQSLENHAGNVIAQNVGEISTGSGDVKCGNVSGSIRTGSGDVECGAVSGNMRTGSGDVCHR
tara:strand:+ start:182 stop:520 length:339 start_codon:yes stop_codon:yes gene_type:complete